MASVLQRRRRHIGLGITVLFAVLVWWVVAPGLPVWWAPRASAEMQAAGRTLFEHEWTKNDPMAGGDGLGPVFNATSCVACHFQGGVGGGGPVQNNVTTFEALPTRQRNEIRAGLVHHFAIEKSFTESFDQVRKSFPIDRHSIRFEEICKPVVFLDFDPLRSESINSTALFGAGWIDRISDRNITHNRLKKGWANTMKEFELDFSSVPVGRPRILADGRVGKFGWRAQFATLRDFVAAACANELGLGTPVMEQAKPLSRPDYPASKPDLDHRQLAALVAFVDTLPRPIEIVPEREKECLAAERGKSLFHSVGCTICHVPDLGGVQGLYSDLLLHDIDDPNSDGYGRKTPPVSPPDDHPRVTEWRTPPLWGVADSAPYFHDGASATLSEAILRHRGDANPVTRAYRKLNGGDQQAIVQFLKTLKAPPDAIAIRQAERRTASR